MAASLEEIVQRQETEQTFYKVNVAMTCYNQKDCIGKAIDSVLAQKTDFPYLIVIGDDASTDGSMELLREYERRFPEKIKVIRQEKNKGINENRRTVFAGCEAPYIAMLDGDDFYTDEEQLQRKFDFLTENHDYIGYFTGGGTRRKTEQYPNKRILKKDSASICFPERKR